MKNGSQNISTVKMERSDWLSHRRLGIGGSDAGAIAGLNPYMSPVEVWLEKTGEEETDRGINHLAEFGLMIEPVIANWWEKQSGMKCRQDHKIRRHPDHKFLLGNLDRTIVARNGEGPGILEIKSTSRRILRDAELEDMPVPAYWIAQIQHYMMVTGYTWGEFAVLVADDRILERIPVQADRDFQNALLDMERRFWVDYVIPRVPPPIKGSEDIIRLFPKSAITSIQASQEIADRVSAVKTLREQKKVLDDAIETGEEAIKIFLGENEALTGFDGKPIVTWKSYEMKRFDSTTFKTNHPDLYSQFQTTVSSRRFLIK